MKANGIDAVYYTVKDLDTETKFYQELIGQEPETHMPGRLSEWTLGDGAAFGLYKTDASGNSGMVMFNVDDVGAAVAESKKRGVHFHDNGEVTDTPVCHMAFGEDPEGNQFILHKRK